MDFSYDLIISIAYKFTLLLLGFFIICIGVRLVKKDLAHEAGNFNADWSNFRIALQNAPLSTYLVVFGALVMVASIFKTINITYNNKISSSPEKNLITKLDADSSFPTVLSKSLNIDSLNVLADYNMKKKNYLMCLRNLYLIKGVLYSKEDKTGLEKKVDSNINIAETAINNIINNQNKSSPSSEETRSANINEGKIDTIK